VSVWGLLLLVGVVWFGILAPLRMHARRQPLASAAKLVLVGGFLLRLATMLASEGIDRYRVPVGLLPDPDIFLVGDLEPGRPRRVLERRVLARGGGRGRPVSR